MLYTINVEAIYLSPQKIENKYFNLWIGSWHPSVVSIFEDVYGRCSHHIRHTSRNCALRHSKIIIYNVRICLSLRGVSVRYNREILFPLCKKLDIQLTGTIFCASGSLFLESKCPPSLVLCEKFSFVCIEVIAHLCVSFFCFLDF